MFGGGLVWFYRVLAGMSTDENKPGYENIIFKPQPAGDITFANYSNLTSNGTASINWKKETDKMIIDVVVPVGSTGTVYVPVSESGVVMESGKKIKNNGAVKFEKLENGYAVYTVGSGKYMFESQI
jgi:alpha-L-rhamnosidase